VSEPRTDQPHQDEYCDHDWQVVNHDENRDVLKCPKCGAVRRE
jgi:hypothetical protein